MAKKKKKSKKVRKKKSKNRKSEKSRRKVKKEIEKDYVSSGDRPNASEIKKYSVVIANMKKEIGKTVSGQHDIIDSLLRALLCDGHVLLEGVPGIAKTLAIRTLAVVSGCSSKRIQFTVDLLPTDITGISSYTPGKGFETLKGPIFANFVIADEINRSPSKTQSALIESMQEKQVTIAKETFQLPKPFFVMATMNPIEQSGVYELPEAQIDRFLFKVIMGYPDKDDELKIMEENITLKKFEDYDIKAITSGEEIIKMQKLVKGIYIDEKVKRYILNIVMRTRTKDFEYGEYIDWGASPRASIAMFIASKAHAMISGRDFVIPSDVRKTLHEVLRHRIILTYRAAAEGLTSDKVIDKILELESP
jgi:MoxR-like ATPase